VNAKRFGYAAQGVGVSIEGVRVRAREHGAAVEVTGVQEGFRELPAGVLDDLEDVRADRGGTEDQQDLLGEKAAHVRAGLNVARLQHEFML